MDTISVHLLYHILNTNNSVSLTLPARLDDMAINIRYPPETNMKDAEQDLRAC